MKTENIFERTRIKKFPYIYLSRINICKILFQCIMIGILGFILETMINLIMNGELVDRGFLYGPFIPLYAITLFLYLIFFNIPSKNIKNFVAYFFITAFSITWIEWMIGNICEILFKSQLWNYEDILFSSTYISLPISFFWGILATSYLMFMVPFVKKISDRIEIKILYKFIYYFFILFCIDMIASIIITIKKGIYEEKYYFYDGIPIFLFISGLIFYFFLVVVIGRFVTSQFKHKNKWIGIFFYPPYILSLLLPLFAMYDYLFRVKSNFIDQLAIVGFFVLALYIYFFLSFLLLVGIKKLFFLHDKEKENNYFAMSILFISLIISITICSVGVQKVRKPIVTNYTIYHEQISKNYHIIVLTDIHYGSTGSVLNIKKMVDDVNALQPDLILMVGDTIDNRLSIINQPLFIQEINRLESKEGIFAVVGNHDIQLNSYDALQFFFSRAGINLLFDECRIIHDDFNLIGRIDYSAKRKKLKDILKNDDLPTIILDHQPHTAMEAKENLAFLQISGHTHEGQIFPYNLFLKVFYYLNFDKTPIYGMKKWDDTFALIISRGYGNWGFPIRTTGSSEIVIIDLIKK